MLGTLDLPKGVMMHPCTAENPVKASFAVVIKKASAMLGFVEVC